VTAPLFGPNLSLVAYATAPILLSITIEDLPPASRFGRAQAVVVSQAGGVVEDDEEDLFILSAQKADHALLVVVGIDPTEASREAVRGMKSGLTTIDLIEDKQRSLYSIMERTLQEMPTDAAVMVPLRPLSDIHPHKEQLLAGLSPHITEEEAEIGEALPIVTGHLADQRALEVYNLIVREGEHEVFRELIHPPESEFIVMEAPIDGLSFYIFEGVMHPTHIPFKIKAETTEFCWA